MRQAVTVLALFLGLGLMSGCGAADPVVQTVDGIVGQMRESAKEMRAVTEELEKVVKKADKENKKIAKKDLAPAIKSMEGLRKVGGKLVEFKTDAERFQAKVTPEKAQLLNEEFKGAVDAEMKNLNLEYEKLKQVSQQVNDLADNQDTQQYFNEEIRIALQEFESLTRLK